MKLLDLLVQELPKRGGWPHGNGSITCNEDNGKVFAHGRLLFTADEPLDPSGLSIIKKEQYEAALAASKQPEWDGEGLPPVGCECELSNAVEFYTHSGSVDFEEGTLVIVGGVVNFGMPGFVAVKVKGSNCITDVNPCFLRPIRTEAERKREEAAKSMLEVIESQKHRYTENAYMLIYDAIAAGKIPGIKLDN